MRCVEYFVLLHPLMKKFFDTYKPHYKALLYLGLPIVIGQIGIIIMGFADTLMIGHHSTEELSAASFVNNVFNLAIIFGTGFSYGLTPIVGTDCCRTCTEKQSGGKSSGCCIVNSYYDNFVP